MKGNFQIILIVVFLAAAVFGVLSFGGVIKIGKDKSAAGPQGTVVLWGTVPSSAIAQPLQDFNDANKDFTVRYVQKYPDTFDEDLVNALASGTGPDLFFLPDDLAYSYRNRIAAIPYQSFPLDAYQSKFASAASVFLTANGILAFPLAVDPLVMYYNRSILDSDGVVSPPATWDDLAAAVPKLTVADDSKKITQSAVALGQYVNVANAKDILAAMFLQDGNPIVTEKNGSFLSVLDGVNPGRDPASSLTYYTGFADPLGSTYTWNRSLPNSADMFTSERLALYFGFASELNSLVNKNPNENILAAAIPQIKGQTSKVTLGRVTGVAVSAFSKNFTTAFTAASLMSVGDFAAKYAAATGAAPARLDLLAAQQTDRYNPTFYASALYARSWLDPDSDSSDAIFQNMIDSILSNTLGPFDAVKDASGKLNFLLAK